MADTIADLIRNFSSDNQVDPTSDSSKIAQGNSSLMTANISAKTPTLLDAWDMARRSAFPAVFGGLTSRSQTSYDFYLDPAIILGAAMMDQATLRWDVEPLRCVFGANGLSSAPANGLAQINASLNYTPVIGWVVIARALDTMSGQANFSIVTSTNGYSGSWSLADINKAGVAFMWQATRSQSRRITWGPGPGDGNAVPTVDPSDLIFDPLTAQPFVVSGANISVDVFPVVLTDSIKRALLYHIANDTLNAFAVDIAKAYAAG